MLEKEIIVVLIEKNANVFVKAVLDSQKNEQNVQRFPIYPWPPNMHSLPIIHIPYWNGTFVRINEPTLIYQYHPKSIVFTLVFKEVINFNMFYLTQCIQIIQHIIYIKINDIFHILFFFCTTYLKPDVYLTLY